MMRSRIFLRRLAAALLLCGAALLPLTVRAQTLSLTDIYYAIAPADSNVLTRTIKLTWAAPPNSITITGLKRNNVVFAGSVDLVNRVALDTSWTSGTSYIYVLYGVQQVEVLDPNGNHYIPPQYTTVPWQGNAVSIKPYDLTVTGNATADSRIDPRYSATTYVNFPFNDSTVTNNPVWLYRGGLYSGYNADGGRVGRTYLKFPLAPSGIAVTVYPLGGLYIFSTRLARTGSASFAVKRSDSGTSWTSSTLNWSNAPNPLGTAGAAKSISYNVSSPVSAWYKIDAATPTQGYLNSGWGTGVLTLILMAQSETTTGWGYFARSEYLYNNASGYGARLIFGIQ